MNETSPNPRSLVVAIVGVLTIAAPAPARAQPTNPDRPWTDRSLSPDRRADLVAARMTLDEMLLLIDGHYAVPATWKTPHNVPPPGALGSAGYVPGIPRLGIPALQESDAGLGVADPPNDATGQPVRGAAGYSTPLPSGLSIAASWNPDIAFQGGAMIATEARREGFNVLLAGGVNLTRDPRDGRDFEYAGEDPLLAGIMVGAQLRAIQSRHVVATVKHFALNDQETGRTSLSADIGWAAARESDFLAFEIAIEQGQPGSVMCAYNRVNMSYACGNDFLLNEVLKEDWKFPGWVMSDWGAVHATADAVAGLDQESGDFFDQPTIWFGGERMRAALASGAVPTARLHDMVHRILRSMFSAGLFDDPPAIVPIDADADAAIAQSAAEQGVVLLKNASNQLPLGANINTIAVIGSHADVGVLAGGGSSEVWPVGGPAVPIDSLVFPRPIIWDPSSPLQAIRREAPSANVRHDDGRDPAAAARLAAASDVAIVFASQWLAESFDAPDLSLPDKQDALIAAVAAANPHTIVVLETGGPVTMPWLDQVAGVLEAWYPGARGGEAIARLLFGRVDPSGRLPITFPRGVAQLPRPDLPGAKNPNAAFSVNYDIEGAAVGYKWFSARHLSPLFPFGFGLSYTRFAYANFDAENRGGVVTIDFDVTNIGPRAGWDTPEIYVRLPSSVGEVPQRLAGFSKVALKPGETRHVTLTLDPRLLAIFNERARQWIVNAGLYGFSLATSAVDPRLTGSVTLGAKNLPP
jgi:beta-glucosidase